MSLMDESRAQIAAAVCTNYQMTYHAIDDVDVSVDLEGGTPVVTARTRTEATIWGGHGIWPLQLRIHFARVGDSWLASNTVASTWR